MVAIVPIQMVSFLGMGIIRLIVVGPLDLGEASVDRLDLDIILIVPMGRLPKWKVSADEYTIEVVQIIAMQYLFVDFNPPSSVFSFLHQVETFRRHGLVGIHTCWHCNLVFDSTFVWCRRKLT